VSKKMEGGSQIFGYLIRKSTQRVAEPSDNTCYFFTRHIEKRGCK
jgi:hypothetical protein